MYLKSWKNRLNKMGKNIDFYVMNCKRRDVLVRVDKEGNITGVNCLEYDEERHHCNNQESVGAECRYENSRMKDFLKKEK